MPDTNFKPHTIDELVTTIYEDNFGHFDFMENMNGGDCDCSLHQTMKTIIYYWGEQPQQLARESDIQDIYDM